MPGVAFVIDDSEVVAALGRLQRAAEHPKRGMDAVGAYMIFSTQRNFERETAPDGTRWAPLSPRTAAKRVGKGRRGFDHILRVTVRLYSSINYEASDSSVEWGSNVEYARVHQVGGLIDMPAREGRVTFKSFRRKGGGMRSRFVRTGTKGATEKKVSIRGHQVMIPARPYLGISAADREEIPLVIGDYLRSEVGR